MTVHFIGAGPGAPDLLTLRGRDLIAAADVVLYAGSLVPAAVVAHARDDATVIDSADMTLDQLIACMREAHEAGRSVARVHSGDPSLYGAIGEQIRRLVELGIDYDITPGVPAYAAAAAALGQELTLPGISQTVVLTRTTMRSSDMPKPGNPRHTRIVGSDAGHPPFREEHPIRRGEPDTPLRRGLPGGHSGGGQAGRTS